MTTLIIDEKSPQAKKFLDFARTLPFTAVVETKKKSFREAAAECEAVSVDTFIDELQRQLKEHYDNA